MYLIRPGKYTICAFVSIQLMSPASGDCVTFLRESGRDCRIVSIQLMSPASGDPRFGIPQLLFANVVSIQLMSPASGDRSNLSLDAILGFVSIQLMSPASGDHCLTKQVQKYQFPFN